MDHSIKIKVEVPGTRNFVRRFDHIEHIPDDWRQPFEQMAEDFWEQNKETFEAEGPGWRPLSPRYAKWKEKAYPGKPILVRTGALKASLTSGFARHSIFEVYPTRMEIGTSIPYAMYHQTGSLKVVDHPPKRSPVEITYGLRKTWNKRLENWLRDEINYQG